MGAGRWPPPPFSCGWPIEASVGIRVPPGPQPRGAAGYSPRSAPGAGPPRESARPRHGSVHPACSFLPGQSPWRKQRFPTCSRLPAACGLLGPEPQTWKPRGGPRGPGSAHNAGRARGEFGSGARVVVRKSRPSQACGRTSSQGLDADRVGRTRARPAPAGPGLKLSQAPECLSQPLSGQTVTADHVDNVAVCQ